MSRPTPAHKVLLDKSFHPDHSQNYALSVKIDSAEVAVSLLDTGRNKLTGLVTTPLGEDGFDRRFDQLLTDEDWLTRTFGQVCILQGDGQSTLVPQPLFDQHQAALYLEFNHPLKQGTRTLWETVKHTDAVHVFGMEEEMVKKLKAVWPNAVLRHEGSVLIEALAVLMKNKNDNETVFVNVGNKRFELVHFCDNKLRFYNSFLFNTKEDFAYFLLVTLEQLELNPETVNLVFAGNIDKSGAVYEIVYRYVRNLFFAERNPSLAYTYALDEVLPHRHFTLFNSLPCE